jgi:hypothetical protein
MVGIGVSISMSKRLTLLLIAVLTLSSIVLVKVAPASAIATPSVPEFTVKYQRSSYYVDPVYYTDKYTGETTLESPGYTVENNSIIISIKNQPFSPTAEPDGNVTSLSYNVRVKGHYEEGWTSLSGHVAASSSGYTVVSYGVGGNAADDILRNVPDGGKLDFQVQACIGYYTRIMPSCYQYNDVFTGNTSGWSATQTVEIGEGQPSTPEPSLPPSQQTVLTLECVTSSSASGFQVDISGRLVSGGVGIANTPILVSYTPDGGQSWISLTTVNTDGNGNFAALWMPEVSGNNRLRVVWTGDAYRTGTSTTVTFAVIPFDEQQPLDDENSFQVTTNSILSNLFFDAPNNELSFHIEGADGTTGYANVYIAKAFLSSVDGLKVYLDGNEVEYTSNSEGDSWVIYFTYSHSSHEVTISLSTEGGLDENQIGQALVFGIPLIATILFFVIIKLKDKKSKANAK